MWQLFKWPVVFGAMLMQRLLTVERHKYIWVIAKLWLVKHNIFKKLLESVTILFTSFFGVLQEIHYHR